MSVNLHFEEKARAAGPAAALFFVSTTGPRAMAPVPEDHADANS